MFQIIENYGGWSERVVDEVVSEEAAKKYIALNYTHDEESHKRVTFQEVDEND